MKVTFCTEVKGVGLIRIHETRIEHLQFDGQIEAMADHTQTFALKERSDCALFLRNARKNQWKLISLERMKSYTEITMRKGNDLLFLDISSIEEITEPNMAWAYVSLYKDRF